MDLCKWKKNEETKAKRDIESEELYENEKRDEKQANGVISVN